MGASELKVFDIGAEVAQHLKAVPTFNAEIMTWPKESPNCEKPL
jgi:hypothetical protein